MLADVVKGMGATGRQYERTGLRARGSSSGVSGMGEARTRLTHEPAWSWHPGRTLNPMSRHDPDTRTTNTDYLYSNSAVCQTATESLTQRGTSALGTWQVRLTDNAPRFVIFRVWLFWLGRVKLTIHYYMMRLQVGLCVPVGSTTPRVYQHMTARVLCTRYLEEEQFDAFQNCSLPSNTCNPPRAVWGALPT